MKQIRILIVEDEPTSRLLMAEVCSEWGSCLTAPDGEKAVKLFTEAMEAGQPYDLICLDIMMPKMDGREALRRIRAYETKKGTLLGEGTKVLMITAMSDSASVMGSFKDHCDGYLMKPISHEKLEDELRKLELI